MKSYHDMLEYLVSLSKKAGIEVMNHYSNSAIHVVQKGDDSPLTLADMASHHCIVRGLQEHYPEIPVLSEESSQTDWEERKNWTRYFLVDPLDGTKEFIKKNDEFTVNIALIKHHCPVLGVVHAPALGVTYFGMREEGAWKESSGGRSAIHVKEAAGQPMRIVGSRSHVSPDMEQFLSQFSSYDMVPMGSSLKLCMVAEGEADFYPRLGLTSEWDTAAAQAVVEAAGGYVVGRSGEFLRYNTKESLLNDWFFVGAGSREFVSSLDLP